MKKTGVILGVMVAAATLFGSGGAVLAAGEAATAHNVAVAQATQPYQGIVGVVSADSDIANGIIVLETDDLGEVTVLLADDTVYRVPGQEAAVKDDIEVGDRLAVLAAVAGDGSYTATRVMIVPAAATRQHLSGVVVSVEDGVMTIINAAGETMTIELPEGVKGGVVGDFISVAVRQSGGKGNFVASGTQTAAEVQARLQTRLNALAGEQVATQAEVQTREQKMARLGEKLEGLMLRNRGVLEQVMAKAPEAAQAAIQAAIGRCEQKMEQIRQTIQNAQHQGSGAQQSHQQSGQSGQPDDTKGPNTTPGGQGGAQKGQQS
ncbi:MAG: hypothetical protein PHY18_04985 [Dehalococcoidales bacterium]|nr:hypothetical protein [Dehalococcoidales bacterium]